LALKARSEFLKILFEQQPSDDLLAARAEAARFTGGLVHSLKLSTVATLEQTLANLRQQHALSKFGLLLPQPQTPQSESAATSPNATEIDNDAPSPTRQGANEPQFTITEVATRPTESNKVWTRFAWKASVANLTTHPLRLSLVVEFLDRDGFVVDQDRKPDLAIGASLTTTFTGFKLVSAASAKNVATVKAKASSR
jgi:hypothetical protein